MDARSQRLWERGLAHFRVGNLAAAQAAFEAMLAIDPDSGPALFRLSLIQARQGRFQASVEDLGGYSTKEMGRRVR